VFGTILVLEERIFLPTPLNRVIVFVGNVEKCARFYQDVFGFAALPSEDPGWIELDTGGCRLAFHQAHGTKGPIHSPTGGRMNPHKIVFFAEDVAATRATIVARGGKMGEIRKFGELVFCDGQDPEGHIFQISNRP
jgi:predicted enzyme related to lactoylglutathione lyase